MIGIKLFILAALHSMGVLLTTRFKNVKFNPVYFYAGFFLALGFFGSNSENKVELIIFVAIFFIGLAGAHKISISIKNKSKQKIKGVGVDFPTKNGHQS